MVKWDLERCDQYLGQLPGRSAFSSFNFLTANTLQLARFASAFWVKSSALRRLLNHSPKVSGELISVMKENNIGVLLEAHPIEWFQ
jgi:hypothetical protein